MSNAVDTQGWMDLQFFSEGGEPRSSVMQFWINSDEDTVVLAINTKDRDEWALSVRVLTNKSYAYPNGKTDAQVWGMPFDALAQFVDAVRALRSSNG